MRRVRGVPEEYTHTMNAKNEPTGKGRKARAYALVDESGSHMFVGLFADEARAEAYCKGRGWRYVR